MKKTIITYVGLLSVVSAGALFATSEFRSPLGRFGDVWLDYRYELEPMNNNSWQVFVQKAGYTRSTSKTFGLDEKCIKDCRDEDKITNKTLPLSKLFFNKADFKGQEAFWGGNLNGRASDAPGLVFSNLSPRITYEERGLALGVHAYTALGSEGIWRLGGRLGLPIKVVEVKEERSCGFERNDNSNNVLSDCVVTCRNEATAENNLDTTEVCAYRLDFLSTLKLPNGNPMVVYGDGTAANPTTIAGLVADTSLQDTNPNFPGFSWSGNAGDLPYPNAPVYLMHQSTGCMPANPINPFFVSTQNAAEDNFILRNQLADGDLPKDGIVNASNNNKRFRFLNNEDDGRINYLNCLGNDLEAQSRWFVIPVPGEGSQPINTLTQEMFNVIKFVVNEHDLDNTILEGATEFFARKGIDLCPSKRVVGVGDLESQVYGGRYWENGYVNASTGFRFPTGKENDNPKCVYFQTPGHNGHFEMLFGVDGGYNPIHWFAFNVDASYHYVFKHTERRAAPFAGSKIRNIGPGVDAEVKWDWFLVNVTSTFFHPKDSNLGCTLGYEMYAKRKDDICLCRNVATDLIGLDHPLDHRLLEENTNSQTHKVRGTGFYRIGYAEFMFGASYIFAGKHSMRETEWHLGMTVSY